MVALIAKTDPTFPLRGSPFHELDQLCGRRVSLVTNTIVLLKLLLVECGAIAQSARLKTKTT